MTKQQIVDCIYQVLSTSMAHPYLSSFQSDAKLIDDLALDSSLVLQLLMFLEVEHGLAISDEALMNADFETVRSLTKVIYDSQGLPEVEKGLEVYEDLKIHCVASSLSEIVKRHPELDHRILYFGVWDAEACVSDDCVLSYHSDTINHTFFTDWYERLYGMKVTSWYQAEKSKEENIVTLTQLVENRTPDQHIMVMLDLYHLPERDNEFSKDPFPHYLMLGTTANADEWMMYDPDYRWEGVAKKERILNAVNKPTVSGGFVFSDKQITPTSNDTIDAYYQACMKLDTNPVTDAIRQVITGHLNGVSKSGQSLELGKLGKAVEEIPVLAPRKYAYEHGFAFFWRELRLPESEFDQLCDDIDVLSKNYKLIQFQAMKLGATENRNLADKILTLLDQQDEREFALKRRLHQAYLAWRSAMFPSNESSTTVQQAAGELV